MRNNFRAQRPTDKAIIAISSSTTSVAQSETVLETATFPCTVAGLRWMLEFDIADAATTNAAIAWAIVLVKDGNSAGTLSISDGGTLYNPEQNCIVWGVGYAVPQQNALRFEGQTKSMRKLMGGDRIILIRKANVADQIDAFGTVQFFCKS